MLLDGFQDRTIIYHALYSNACIKSEAMNFCYLALANNEIDNIIYALLCGYILMSI